MQGPPIETRDRFAPDGSEIGRDRPLFRREAVAGSRYRLHGEVMLAQPPGLVLASACVVLLAIVACTVLAHTTFPRTETVPGFIGTSHDLVTLRAPRFGRLLQRHVELGDYVRAGQVMFAVTTGIGAPHASEDPRLESLDRRLDAIGEQRALLDREFAHRDRLLGLDAESASRESASRAEQLSISSELLGAASTELDRLSALADRGFATRAEVDRQRSVVLAHRADVLELEARQRDSRQALRRAELEREMLPAERRRTLSGLDMQLQALRHARYEEEQAQGYTVRAPVSGTVVAVQGDVGQEVGGPVPVATILPDGAEFVGILLVPSNAIGFLEPGDDVRLRITAFPFPTFGSLAGRIADISRSAYGPGELRSPVAYTSSVYKVVVHVQLPFGAAGGRRLPLQPDMTLTAAVTTDRRTLLDWLFAPLDALRG